MGRATDSPEAIEERIAKASAELEFAHGKVDRELINDKLEPALREAEIIVDEFLSR